MTICRLMMVAVLAGLTTSAWGGPEDCPVAKDRFTLKSGDLVWEGTILNLEANPWPQIAIDASATGRGQFKTTFSQIKEGTLEWEGVTNAKKCYYEPGVAAYQAAQDLFKQANQKTPPDAALLDQAKDKFQEVIDLISKVKPQAEGYFDKQFIYSEGKKLLDVAEIMVPKLNAALHFNSGVEAFEKAVAIKGNGEIQGAIADLATCQRDLGVAVKDYAALSIKLKGDEQAEASQKAGRCRRYMQASEVLTKYLQKTVPLFEMQGLKEQAQDFPLENLRDGIERNTILWRQVAGALADELRGGKLGGIQQELAARRQTCEDILDYRQSHGSAIQKSAKDAAGIRPAMDLEDFETARSLISSVRRRLDNLDSEEFANQGELNEIQEIVDQMTCFETEINFHERSLAAKRDAEAGLRNAEDHERLARAYQEFRSLTNEAAKVDALCASEPWVEHTATNAAGFVERIAAHMVAEEWIRKGEEMLAPTLGNFQKELDEHTAAEPLEGDPFNQAVYYHEKVLEILRNDPSRAKDLSLESKTGNAKYLIAHARKHRAAKDYDAAMERAGLVSTYYSDSPLKGEAFREGWTSWALKNLAILIGVAVLLLIVMLVLFLRRFSAKVIERKMRNKLHALDENRKMDPAKKAGKIDGVIKKLESLESRRKLSKNGRAYAKMAYVDKAVCLLRMGDKEEADKAIERAGEFQRVEPEDIMPHLSVYHLKQQDTSEEAMEVYSEYLNLPDHVINPKLEADIRELVAGIPAAPEHADPGPDGDPERFTTAPIDIAGGGSAPPTPPPPPPPPPPPTPTTKPKTITTASKKKKVKSVVIRRKK